MKANYDIVIVGAGLVGMSLVHALQGLNLRIAVLDQQLTKLLQISTDARPLALTYASYQYLQAVQLWPSLAEMATPIQAVHVSEMRRFGRCKITAADLALPVLGYVVPYGQLQHVFMQKALEYPQVDLIAIQEITALRNRADDSEIEFTTQEKLQIGKTKLLVVADGSHSTCRDLLGVAVDQQNHQDQAIIATLQLSAPHDGMAYQRFIADGTVALLPLSDPMKMRVVITMSEIFAKQVVTWGEAHWLSWLTEVFSGRLERLRSIKNFQQFPLSTVVAKQQIGPRFVLLGNAAHTLYPVAAQGFNLSLRDVAALAEVIQQAVSSAQDWGNENVLQRYVDWRKVDQRKTLCGTQFLMDWFACQFPLLGQMRGLGLLGLDLLSPLKKIWVKQMMGLTGKIPKLLNGLPLHVD